MSTHDDDRDAEMTTDWPGSPRGDDDGEATTVVPRTPHHGAPPPMSPPPSAPPMSPPPTSPPQAAPWNPQWQNTPNAGPPPGGGWGPPAAPGQYPPGYPPAVAPKPRRGPRWGLLGVGAVVVVVIVFAATIFVMRDSGSSAPAPAPTSTSAAPTSTTSASASAPNTAAPPSPTPSPAAAAGIDPAGLKGLLASVPEISELVGNVAMEPNAIFDAPFRDVVIDPATCTGAVMPGDHNVYNGSGFTGFAGQVLSDASQDNKVIQSIASFPSEAEAKAFVDKQFADWQACKYTDVTVTIAGSVSDGTVAVSAITDGTNNVFIFPPGGGAGRQCQHAMTPRKNVVVDVRVCASSVGSMGWTLARDIGEKITGQR
ncbi:sensor domain-containing protein [Mycobacterium sp.]|uniref:sensor domain-containing protein n=1 Tax=Mycobacterium sp. TaxID=1785 RepID=UPI002D99AE7D|nr:sensor domain-containing protein [Mycobacterium sp.]